MYGIIWHQKAPGSGGFHCESHRPQKCEFRESGLLGGEFLEEGAVLEHSLECQINLDKQAVLRMPGRHQGNAKRLSVMTGQSLAQLDERPKKRNPRRC